MPVKIDTVAMGNVDSAGILIYCIGEKRHVVPGSSFLFHPMVTRGISQSRRSEEAASRSIESMNTWIDGVFEDCFGGMPTEWDIDRRDYRALASEATEIGLANAGPDFMADGAPVGAVSFISPQAYGGNYIAQ
jgi:ATP-dependent protease ClpP protease subunit